ncbi:carbohydrate kinase family protein [Testudinibacter sp. TR-2022]|uniref:carbohydrate kinase family protein n=1 Tax=Testudinibacter sp. TR-2022 TaxID=2585029 RepID=UPI00111AE1A5|nr:carbohydrate kinase family protein [Testudinibacter sp. TR-2022]TNH08264.1 carbohydrate kinase family protein [Pasteurellaceae bacterium Phil11]TNH24440.1 carbohydrate kinase family protein [Testudinibacter sp. TR-2022]TNH26672.1 carbohydrate kinase family protein [Testudinibacter sp. TR-2022]
MDKRHGILAIGNLLIDRTLVISDYPQETMLTTISEIEQHCGGGCTNILFNLATLDPDLPLFLSGAVGEDQEAQFILNQAKAHNINIEAVCKVVQPTSFTDVMINSQTGDRTFFHYVGAMESYGKEQLLKSNQSAKIAHIAYLPLLPALLNDDLADTLQALRQQGLLLSIDLVSVRNKTVFSDYIRPILSCIDFVIINDIEAKILLEMENLPATKENLAYLAQKIFQLGVKRTVIIHSPEWAVACDHTDKPIAVASYWLNKQDIISTLGAGDAFCAGCLYGLHQDFPLEQTLKLGHCLAYFNLFSISATGGAVTYAKAMRFLAK